jgi:hypothetical protein
MGGLVRRVASVIVGLAMLVGVGGFSFGLLPMINRGGVATAAQILTVSLLAVAAALVSGWLFGVVSERSWRLGAVILPLAIVVGLVLFLGSSVPMGQACRTYHTDTACPPGTR